MEIQQWLTAPEPGDANSADAGLGVVSLSSTTSGWRLAGQGCTTVPGSMQPT
jgi:hypothetical protein